MFKPESVNFIAVIAFFNSPFNTKSNVALPDLKLYAFLISFGAKALNNFGRGIAVAFTLISATDFSSILPSMLSGAPPIRIPEFLISNI